MSISEYNLRRKMQTQYKDITNKQIKANAGLFYACYKLSLLNFIVLPTTRNSKGADIFLVKDNNLIGIQVKTLFKKNDVYLSNYGDPGVNYWIIVTFFDGGIRSYIIPSTDIRSGVDNCNKGINSNVNLVYNDNPKNGVIKNYWINKGFISKVKDEEKDKNNPYLERWDLII